MSWLQLEDHLQERCGDNSELSMPEPVTVSPVDVPVSHERTTRTRRLLEAVGSAALSKGVLMLASALTIPIAIRYLGAESFGIWVTITTALTMLLVLDLGIASSLTNFISEAYARNDHEHASRYTTTALAVMTCIAMLLGIGSWILWPNIHWGSLFNLSSATKQQTVSHAVAAAFVLFLIDLPSRLAVKVLGGYQEMRTANLFAMIGGIANLAAIVLLVKLHAGLPAMVAGSAGALVGADLLCLLWLLSVHKPWLRPRIAHLHRAAARRMMRMGTEFFILQIAGLVVFSSDNLVITHYLGPAEVAPYSVAWRLVGYASVIQALLIPALWPAFSEAFERGDMIWVRQAFRRTMWITMGTTFCFAILFALAGRWFIRVWATNAAVPSETLILLMCVWILISTSMSNVGTLLASKCETRLQAWCSIGTAAVNLLLSIWLIQRIGTTGVIMGTIISYLLVLVVPMIWQTRRILRG
jgi:O-antigen/teichoic acid export membrane protein